MHTFSKRNTLSKDQCPKTPEVEAHMRRVPYASAVGSLMYVMLYTRPDIYYVVRIVSRYQSNLGPKHWKVVNHILRGGNTSYDTMG